MKAVKKNIDKQHHSSCKSDANQSHANRKSPANRIQIITRQTPINRMQIGNPENRLTLRFMNPVEKKIKFMNQIDRTIRESIIKKGRKEKRTQLNRKSHKIKPG